MIILATTPTEETPEAPEPDVVVPARPRLHFTWIGTDGTEWDLGTGAGDPDAGTVKLARGASGFGLPKPEHWLQQAPTLDGATWSGLRVGPRDVFMPVNVRGADADGMLDLEAAFFAGLDPLLEGQLRATTHRGTSRSIALRYDDGGDVTYDLDPVLIRYASYPLRLVATDPYWSGAEIVWDIPYPTATPSFFTGPPFRLAPSSILGSATVTNPGDVDAFPLWRIDGPFTGFSVGVGDSLVEATVTKTAGEYVEIDMRRDRLTVVDETGEDLRPITTAAAFTPIPPGTSQLATTLLGASAGSTVTLTFTPRHRRAW